MTTTAAQINVRLDADLKRSGDAALSRAGMTPSQAVRALWQLAASLADRPGALEDILLPSRARAEQRERENGDIGGIEPGRIGHRRAARRRRL